MDRALPPRLVFALCLCAGTALHAQEDCALRDYIAARCQRFGDEALPELVRAAVRDGVIRTPAEQARFKEAFVAVLGKAAGRPGTGQWPHDGVGPVLPPLAVGPELEFNDTTGFADAISPNGTTTGTLATLLDRDVYRMTLTADSDVTISLRGATASPPLLTLSDQDGRHVANGAFAAPLRSVRALLPAGTYLIGVGYQSSPQNYTLTTAAAPATIPVLVAGGPPQSGAFGVAGELRTWKLVLGGDAQVQLSATGSAGLDLNLTLGRARGGRIFYVDDYGVAGVLDPRLTSALPAGTYYAFFGELLGRTGSFTVSTTVTPAPLPLVSCTSPLPGSITDKGTRDVYRLVVPAPDQLVFATAPNGSPTLNDGILELFDADFGELCEDDDNGASFQPRLELPLPAGVYYLVVRGYNDRTGGYNLNTTCNQPPAWIDLAATHNQVSVPSGASGAYKLELRTTSPVQFTSADRSAQLTVMDQTGKLRFHVETSAFVTTVGPGMAFTGGTMTVDQEVLYVLIRTATNAPLATSLLVESRLWTDAAGVLNSIDKAGIFHVLLAGRGPAPASLPLAPPFTGHLLIDPTRLILVIDAQPMGGNGRHAWPFSITGYGGVLQAIALDLTTITGAASNLLP